MQGTELHPTLKGAIEELIEFGSGNYLETLHRTNETVERISLRALALDMLGGIGEARGAGTV